MACASTNVAPVIVHSKPVIVSGEELYLKMPWIMPVAVVGELDQGKIDSVSVGGPLIDHGLGGAGLAAQLLGQAAMANSAKDRRYAEARALADAVLEPYRALLDNFHHDVLWQGLDWTGTPKFSPFVDGGKRDNAIIVEMTPTLTLAQDLRGISLDNEVTVFRESDPEDQLLFNRFIIISNTLYDEEPNDHWLNSELNSFESMGSELFNESVIWVAELLLNGAPVGEKQKTHTYLFGGKKEFVRGHLLRETCQRIVVKDLRGNIISAPKTPRSSSECSRTEAI